MNYIQCRDINEHLRKLGAAFDELLVKARREQREAMERIFGEDESSQALEQFREQWAKWDEEEAEYRAKHPAP